MEQCDLVSSRLIAMEKTDEWAEANGVQSSVVEVSAKNDENVRTIFRKLFDQARLCTAASAAASAGGVDATAAAVGRSPGHARHAPSVIRPVDDPLLKRHFSANAARMNAKRVAGGGTANSLTVGGGESPTVDRDKPMSRSRSLIRRMRKPKVKDSAELAANDCVIC